MPLLDRARGRLNYPGLLERLQAQDTAAVPAYSIFGAAAHGQDPVPSLRGATPMDMAMNFMPMGIVKAFHGSPYKFDRFSNEAIGTGEGAQAYGYGHYFADNPTVAKSYQGKVSAMRGSGHPTIEGRPIDWNNPVETAAYELARHNGDRAAAADFHSKNFLGGEGNEAVKLLRSDASLPPVKLPGHLYEASLNLTDDTVLHWDKPLSEQPKAVREALEGHGVSGQKVDIIDRGENFRAGDRFLIKVGDTPIGGSNTLDMARKNAAAYADRIGQQLYHDLHAKFIKDGAAKPAKDKEKEMVAALNKSGIKGIKYLDQGSRAAGEGTYNYVVFNPDDIEILKVMGLMPMAGGD